MKDSIKWLIGGGIATGIVLWASSANADSGSLDMNAQLPPLFGSNVFDWSTLGDFLQRLPSRAAPYATQIGDLAQRWSVHPAGVYALVDFESDGFRVTDTGVGGDGHGHRWFQIDDRSHSDWLNNNPDPGDFENDGDYAIGSILVPAYQAGLNRGLVEPMATRFAFAAYNAGVNGAWHAYQNTGDPNNATWHQSYIPGIASRFGSVTN